MVNFIEELDHGVVVRDDAEKDCETHHNFQFNINACQFIPSTPPSSITPRAFPKSSRRNNKLMNRSSCKSFVPIHVPEHKPGEVAQRMERFINMGKQYIGHHSTHPQMMESKVHKIRIRVNQCIEKGDRSPSPVPTPRTGRRVRRKRKVVTRPSPCAPSSSCFGVLQRNSDGESSPWVVKSRANDQAGPTHMQYVRKIQATFNKLSPSNYDTIVYERVCPLVLQYLSEDEYDTKHVFDHLSTNLIDMAASSASKVNLACRISLSLILFNERLIWDDRLPDYRLPESTSLRNILIKMLHVKFQSAMSTLTQELLNEGDLEEIIKVKDQIRCMTDYTWGLATRGILPNKILRRMVSRMTETLGDEVVNYEKLAMLVLSGKDQFCNLGGEALLKCETAWHTCDVKMRDSIAKHMNGWSQRERCDVTRITILMEIAESEGKHRQGPEIEESYPIRVSEKAQFDVALSARTALLLT
eukprot:GHVH01000931.1.p1 GENE.GHVH01000931.1~~GHVH01000931.1.p1  ORF type:complete len:471 (+),score=50.62 GHVH01000931.1:392-1804(+)